MHQAAQEEVRFGSRSVLEMVLYNSSFHRQSGGYDYLGAKPEAHLRAFLGHG